MILFLTVIVVIVSTILIYVKFWWSNREYFELAEKFQGPPGFPFIGNLNLFMKHSTKDIIKIVRYICTPFDSPVRIWIGPYLFLNIKKPIDIQRVLQSTACTDKLYIYRFLTQQPSVMAAEYEISRIHRKLLNPYFDSNLMRSHTKSFKANADILVERLQKEALAGTAFDVRGYVTTCTLDALCATLIGIDVNTQSGHHMEFLQAITDLLELIDTRVFNILLHSDIFYRGTDLFRCESELRRKISGMTSEMIKDKRAKSKPNLDPNPENDDLSIIATYINSTDNIKYLSEKLRKEIEGLIVVGNEMTALTVSFAILMLAIHPTEQDRIYTELKRVGAKENIAYEDQLNELNYLEMVIKETQRLFPLEPMVVRKCRTNVDLPSGKVPKGAYLLIDIYNLHRDPEIWGDDANSFDPDRFGPLDIKYRHPYGYIPFGGGRKMCLGQNHAMRLIKVMLVEIVKRYRISTDLDMDDIKFEMGMTLKLKFQSLIKLSPR